jgi:hypothetical protein
MVLIGPVEECSVPEAGSEFIPPFVIPAKAGIFSTPLGFRLSPE